MPHDSVQTATETTVPTALDLDRPFDTRLAARLAKIERRARARVWGGATDDDTLLCELAPDLSDLATIRRYLARARRIGIAGFRDPDEGRLDGYRAQILAVRDSAVHGVDKAGQLRALAQAIRGCRWQPWCRADAHELADLAERGAAAHFADPSPCPAPLT